MPVTASDDPNSNSTEEAAQRPERTTPAPDAPKDKPATGPAPEPPHLPPGAMGDWATL